MGQFQQPPSYPNVMLAYGDDLAPPGRLDYRERLRRFLYSDAASDAPVRRGTHDFWITYPLPPDGSADYDYPDRSTVDAFPLAREMRGIVHMGNLPPEPSDLAELGWHLGVNAVMQEVGHYWLVPRDLTVAVEGVNRPIPDGLTAMTQFVSGMPFSGPLLFGRAAGLHWSTFFDADASPMDGMHWREVGRDGAFLVWEQHAFEDPVVVTPDGLPPLTMPSQFCDLDLVIMGMKSPTQAYPATDGRFRWIEPRHVTPLGYHAGLCVAFSPSDLVTFGFCENYRQLRADRTGTRGTSLDVGRGYRPFDVAGNGVALRAVRRGSRLYLQARYDNPVAVFGVLFGGTPPDPFGGLDDSLGDMARPGEGLVGDRFKTVAIFDGVPAPQAVGVMAKTWKPIAVTLGIFRLIQLRQDGQVTGLDASETMPRVQGRVDYGALSPSQLVLETAAAEPTLRMVRSTQLELTVNGRYDHWTGVDDAPKILARAPEGDFELVGTAHVARSAFAPWAAGDATGTRIVGRVKSASIRDVVLSADAQAKASRVPADRTYKMAFIVVAGDRAEISEDVVSRLDGARRYWEAVWRATTGTYCNTSLS